MFFCSSYTLCFVLDCRLLSYIGLLQCFVVLIKLNCCAQGIAEAEIFCFKFIIEIC